MKRSETDSVRRAAAFVCSACLALALCGLFIHAAIAYSIGKETRVYTAAHTESVQISSLPTKQGSVRVNDADLQMLTQLYGVGETYAQHIIDERETNGPFFFPEDLLAVKGIGQKRLAGFYEQIDMSLAEQ